MTSLLRVISANRAHESPKGSLGRLTLKECQSYRLMGSSFLSAMASAVRPIQFDGDERDGNGGRPSGRAADRNSTGAEPLLSARRSRERFISLPKLGPALIGGAFHWRIRWQTHLVLLRHKRRLMFIGSAGRVAAWTSNEAPGEGDGETSSHGGDRV